MRDPLPTRTYRRLGDLYYRGTQPPDPEDGSLISQFLAISVLSPSGLPETHITARGELRFRSERERRDG